MVKNNTRTSTYRSKKRQNKGAKEKLKVKNASLANTLEEFHADRDMWKLKAKSLTK